MSLFSRYIGIDYSGAKTPTGSLKGLRVYMASGTEIPAEEPPPPSPRKYWTRRGLAEWLVATLRETEPTVVGIDHAFSFPQAYFDRYDLPHDWHTFLDDFCAHWPTDDDHMYVDFVRDGLYGNGAARTGDTRWRRLTDLRSRTAKSPFHFDVQGSVAKSTHSGLPWLRYINRELAGRVHFWPFDGWNPPTDTHVRSVSNPPFRSRGGASAASTARTAEKGSPLTRPMIPPPAALPVTHQDSSPEKTRISPRAAHGATSKCVRQATAPITRNPSGP